MMEWDIEYLPDHKVLVVRARGTLDAAASEQVIAAGAAAAAQHDCTRHLVDYRQARVSLSVLDMYHRPDLYREQGMPHNTCIALLFSRLDNDTRFREAVAVNRGVSLRTFTSEDQALAWLCGNSSQPQ
jgi:hypothetical protein